MSTFALRSPSCLLVVFAALGACSSPSGPTRQAEPGPGDPGSADGALSEAEFKRLHELAPGAPPLLAGQEIRIGAVVGYLALPARARVPLTGVVVIHEWWGLNDHVKHWTDRLAAEGYAALAIDLYGGVVATTPDAASSAMKSVDAGRALETLLAAERFLIDHPDVRAARTASIGWCFGGSQSLGLALTSRDLDACVVYYGQPVTDPARLAGLQAPLLGIFGTRDASIPESKLAAFEGALRAAGKDFRIARFDAEHAFANPSNARYDTANASRAWELVRAFLAQHLGSKR